MMTQKIKIYQVLYIVTIMIYACSPKSPVPINTPTAEQMDKSPFTGIPCAAPCWYGLEVGKSSESDVMSILPTLRFINQETIQVFQGSMPNYDYSASASGVLIEANCVNSEQQCLTIAVIDNILTKIEIGLNYEITPDEAIEYLGEPNYIGFDNLGSERVICEVYMVWTDWRLILASRFENIGDAEKYCYIVHYEEKIPSNVLILEARYLSDAELNAYLTSISSEFFEFTETIPNE